MAIKEHKIINLKNINTGIVSSFALGRMWADENDWANGGYVDLDGATNIYDFCRKHPGEQFLIQGLEGLQFNISEAKNNGVFWADAEKTKQLPQFTVTINCPTKSGVGGLTYVEVYPSGTVTENHKFWISGWNTVEMPGTTGIHKCFVWNETENLLSLVGASYKIMGASIGYEITVELNRKTFRYSSRFQHIPVVSGITQIIPVLENLGTDPHLIDNVWRFMFRDYKQLNTGDKDDDDKQKPIEWAYPNGPSGPTKPGGGDGNQDDDKTPIIIEDAPDISCDFAKLYKITKSNLRALADYMLKDDFLNNIKKLYANPIDALICLSALPVNQTGTSSVITTSGVSTGINAVLITKNTIDIDLGYVTVNEYWGSYLDYESRLSLYLPYIGMKQISTDDFMNNIIKIKYRVDLLTGSFIVFVSNDTGIVHQSTGNMAYHIPVTSIDYSRFYASLISAGISLAGASSVGAVASIGLSTAQNMKPAVHMGGNFSGNVGFCGNKKPFLMIERPILSIPQNYTKYNGLTSNIYTKLSNCKGFTKVKEIFLDNVTLLDSEKEILKSILKNGVIL